MPVGDVFAERAVDAPFGRADDLAVLLGQVPRVEPHQARAVVGGHHFGIGADQLAQLVKPGRRRRR